MCVYLYYNSTCFVLDREIAQHEHQKPSDELQPNQQKVKHLESNITKLYHTAKILKKGNR